MQRWEYLRVLFDYNNGYYPRIENGIELPNWKNANTNVSAYFNQKGELGWELIAYQPGGETSGGAFGYRNTYYLAIFKRPLS